MWNNIAGRMKMSKIKNVIHKARRNAIVRWILDVLFLFIYGYISNNIINKIPNCKVRYWFYTYVLNLKISEETYIMMGCYIYPDLRPLKIGKNTIINSDVILDRRGGLIIGSNVNISREVAIYTGGHEIDSSGFAYYSSSVIINDYVWIGTRAMIMPGVTIGEGAVILPGAIVTHDCEPYTVYAGIPAKKIRMRNKDLNYELTWRSYFL